MNDRNSMTEEEFDSRVKKIDSDMAAAETAFEKEAERLSLELDTALAAADGALEEFAKAVEEGDSKFESEA